MANIVELKPREYQRRKKKMENLLEEVKGIRSRDYSPAEIEDMAEHVLSVTGLCPERSSIPIIKIADKFGIEVYEGGLDEDFPGDIRINGDTAKRFGHEKVILVNEKEDPFRKRYLAAHEFAHYIFEFPWDPSYKDSSILFSDKYHKDHHESLEEKRANRFAAAILMPRDLFAKQYYIAKEVDSNETFIMMYLSDFFETPIDSVNKRIREVLG